jgi:DNA-binding transcriptional MerR regulator
MNMQYKSKDICEATGCTQRQLQYWEKKGYIKPKKGSRNVRLYKEVDLNTIKHIINLKKKGSSLGEAFSKTNIEHSQNSNLVTNDTFILLKKKEEKYLELNDKLLQILFEIQEYEASLPYYPLSVYKEDNLIHLRKLQETAKDIKNKKNIVWTEIVDILKTNTKTFLEVKKIFNKPDKEDKYSIDQLILLWIKKNGTYNNLNIIREEYLEKIKKGASIDALIQELLIQPEKSK